MDQRIALVFLSLAAPACLVLPFLPVSWAGEAFAVLAVASPLALIALGAARDGRLGPLRLPLLALGGVLEGSLVAMLALRGAVDAAPWFGGLPLSAAVMIYGIFVLPLPLVGLAYALTFDRFTLRDRDLAALSRFSGAAGRDDRGEP